MFCPEKEEKTAETMVQGVVAKETIFTHSFAGRTKTFPQGLAQLSENGQADLSPYSILGNPFH